MLSFVAHMAFRACDVKLIFKLLEEIQRLCKSITFIIVHKYGSAESKVVYQYKYLSYNHYHDKQSWANFSWN